MNNNSVVVLRVSSDIQDNNMQRLECMQYAKENNLNVLKILESKISGYKTLLEDMESLQEVMNLASQGLIQNVVFWKVDRIGRQLEFLTFFETMERNDVVLHSVTEGILKAETSMDKLMLILRLFSAETEAESTSKRVITAIKTWNEMQMVNENGELEDVYVSGNIPFGTHLIDTGIIRNPKKNTTWKRVVYIPELKEIVERIFNMYLYENESTESIARWLNENHVPLSQSKNGKWNSSKVGIVLKNTAYVGRMRYNTSKYKSSKSKVKIRLPESEWKYKNMPHLRIISDSEREMVLKKLKDNNTKINTTTNGKGSDHVLLNGLVYCGVCGNKMYINSSPKYNNKKGHYHMYYYYCKKAKLDKDKEHKQISFSAKVIDELFYEKLINVIDEYDFDLDRLDADLDFHNKAVIKKLSDTVNKLETEAKDKQEILDGLQKEIGLALVGKSKFNQDVLSKLIDDTEAELGELKTNLLENKSKLIQAEDNISEKLAKMEKFKNFKELAEVADFKEKKQLIRSIVKKVILEKGNMNIQLDLH